VPLDAREFWAVPEALGLLARQVDRVTQVTRDRQAQLARLVHRVYVAQTAVPALKVRLGSRATQAAVALQETPVLLDR